MKLTKDEVIKIKSLKDNKEELLDYMWNIADEYPSNSDERREVIEEIFDIIQKWPNSLELNYFIIRKLREKLLKDENEPFSIEGLNTITIKTFKDFSRAAEALIKCKKMMEDTTKALKESEAASNKLRDLLKEEEE